MSDDFEGKAQEMEKQDDEEDESDDDEELDKEMGETGEGAETLDQKVSKSCTFGLSRKCLWVLKQNRLIMKFPTIKPATDDLQYIREMRKACDMRETREKERACTR